MHHVKPELDLGMQTEKSVRKLMRLLISHSITLAESNVLKDILRILTLRSERNAMNSVQNEMGLKALIEWHEMKPTGTSSSLITLEDIYSVLMEPTLMKNW